MYMSIEAEAQRGRLESRIATWEAVTRARAGLHVVELRAVARLDDIRARGVAVSEGENAYGLLTVAAPVLDAAGAPLAAVSLTAAAGRDAAAFTAAAIPAARELAGTLATAITSG